MEVAKNVDFSEILAERIETVGDIDILIPTMLTIGEVAERTGLAKHYVRKLVLDNQIHYIKAGRKYLINYEKLIQYLDSQQINSVLS